MNPKIVKLNTGSWAIQTQHFPRRFIDLTRDDKLFTHRMQSDEFEKNCQGAFCDVVEFFGRNVSWRTKIVRNMEVQFVQVSPQQHDDGLFI